MASERGNETNQEKLEAIIAAQYEMKRAVTMRTNQNKLDEILASMRELMNIIDPTNSRKPKRKKQNLPPRPLSTLRPRSSATTIGRDPLQVDALHEQNGDDEEELEENEVEEDELEENGEDEDEVVEGDATKKGRKYTKKHNIWKRGNQPRIQLEINEHGQPVGSQASELSNFIATIVKSKDFSLAYKDWRLVPALQKLKLWRDLQLFYEVDETIADWVMGNAAKIWRDFKADLKRNFFYENKTDKDLLSGRDERVNAPDWKWLISHWRSPLAKQRSDTGKANRAKLDVLHTSGSKSYARVGHEMTALQQAADEHPEWTEKSIKEGDLMSRVFGPEKSRFVRSVGRGPTPADLEMPGKQKYKSTKLEMALEAKRQAEIEKNALVEQFERRQAESDKKIDDLTKKVTLLSEVLLGSHKDGPPVHFGTRYESNSAVDENGGQGQSANQQDNDAQSSDTEETNTSCSTEKSSISFVENTSSSTANGSNSFTANTTFDCFEVVVNHVTKKTAPLLRPYGDMNTLADAVGRSIAWPRQHIKECRKSPRKHQDGSHDLCGQNLRST